MKSESYYFFLVIIFWLGFFDVLGFLSLFFVLLKILRFLNNLYEGIKGGLCFEGILLESLVISVFLFIVDLLLVYVGNELICCSDRIFCIGIEGVFIVFCEVE